MFAAGGPTAEEIAQSPRARDAMREDKAWMDVGRWIKDRAFTKLEAERRAASEKRIRLFRCKGTEDALALINEVFKDTNVKQLRAELVPYARFDNPLRRFTLERARVYAKPVKSRTVKGKANNELYQDLQRRTQHDRALKAADQLLALCNDVWLGFRVRETPRGREPRIDVASPDRFRVLCDKHDKTKLVAVILDMFPDGDARSTDKHYTLWSDHEVMDLDKHGNIMVDTIGPNPFGRIPGVLVSSDYRTDALLDPDTGDDAVAAHLANWLLNTMMLKESKSLNKQAAYTGETGRSPVGQSQDSERDIMLAEGVGVTTIDRGVDVTKYMTAADHVVERAGANHGIPPSVLRHAGATSGYEIDLRRIPLEEIREDRIGVWRDAERAFAEVEAVVLAEDMPELAFKADGWHVDFAEIRRPLPPGELYDVRKKKRAMGHSDPVIEAMEDNPDFDDKAAADWVASRVMANQTFVQEVQARTNTPADADAENPGRSPQENGALAQRDDDAGDDHDAEVMQ